MNQFISIARNKNIYVSRDELLNELNTSIEHYIAMPLLHLYYKNDNNDIGAMLTIGIANGIGNDKYQIVINEIDLNITINELENKLGELNSLITQTESNLHDEINTTNESIETLKTSIESSFNDYDKRIEKLENEIGSGVVDTGMVKINSSDEFGYIEDKIVSGENDLNNGRIKVDYNIKDGKYQATVDIPIFVWKTL